jgi:signal transduction histidine kinase
VIIDDQHADRLRAPYGVHSLAGGHGLIGMRERVSLYGGELTAAPLPRRGFRVAARLPIGDGGS